MAGLERLCEVIKTDVLVVGGSISGGMAAIKARESGAEVLIVDKATAGWGGQGTLVGGGTFVLRPEDDLDSFVAWMLELGEDLNDMEWLLALARDSWGAVKEAMQWGAYNKRGDDPMTARFSSFQTHYPFAQMAPGNIEQPFIKIARQMGVKMMSKIVISDLLKDSQRIAGAIGFNIIDGRPYIFQAKAVILAAGSCDFKANRLCISSGESVSMAYNAGAELRNAEFGNLYAPATREYDIWADGIVDEYFYNTAGENIRWKYVPGVSGDYRKITLGIVQEVKEGRGPIFMDLSQMPAEDRDVVTKSFSIKEVKELVAKAGPPQTKHPRIFSNNWIWETYKKVGTDPFTSKQEVWPSLQGKCGPIRVNMDAASTVPGLWAVGDSSAQGAGWSGAICGPGQLHGTATAYCLVSGRRAGLAAGRYAMDTTCGEIDYDQANTLKEELFAPLKRTKGLMPADAIYRVQEIVVPVKYNLQRSEDRLKEGLAIIGKIKSDLDQLWARDSHELCKCNEARSMALCAEIIFKAALMRQETRGYHIRDDYPQRDDKNWHKWVIVKNQNGKMTLSTEPVPRHKTQGAGHN